MQYHNPAEPGNFFRTSDINLAAFLLVSRSLAGTERTDERVTFLFWPDPLLEGDVADFNTFRGAVAPARYAQTLRSLKAVVHGTLRKDRGAAEGSTHQARS